MRYSNDPKWIKAKFNSKCKECGNEIKKGDDLFYYPVGKHALCKICGEKASNEFNAMAFDECVYNNSF